MTAWVSRKRSRIVAGQPAPASGPAVITGVSSDGTYLTDQYGQPRMMVGDTVWSIVANAGRWNSGDYQSTFDTYFAARAAQGYTAAEVSFLSTGDPNDNFPFSTGQDWDGAWPFNGSADPTTTPNATFWARRDYLFASAASNGITIVCNFPGVGPSSPCANWTTAQWTAYGTFLGNRYKAQPNIIWICGDGTFGSYDAGLATWRTAVRAAGDAHIISYEAVDEQSSRYSFQSGTGGVHADPDAFSIYAELDWVYTYNVSYLGVTYSIQNEPSATDVVQGRIPVVWADGNYLGAGVSSGQTDTHLVTQMIWWAMSSGACGWNTGDNDIFSWGSSSAGFVTSKTFYSAEIPAIASYLSSLPGWQKLRPDLSSALVTAGRGTQSPLISVTGDYTANTDSYVTAAYAADGSLAVIYCGLAFSITIDQTKMVSGYTATWVDPASCATSSATPGSTYSSSGKGNNSAGYTDWALVLKAP